MTPRLGCLFGHRFGQPRGNPEKQTRGRFESAVPHSCARVEFGLSMISSVIDDPSSSLSFWLSEIPFTSPVIMLVRIAMGIGPSSVEVWEIMLSVGLLFATFILTTWLSSKIYANGVLSFGKKASYKELFKWLKS